MQYDTLSKQWIALGRGYIRSGYRMMLDTSSDMYKELVKENILGVESPSYGQKRSVILMEFGNYVGIPKDDSYSELSWSTEERIEMENY